MLYTRISYTVYVRCKSGAEKEKAVRFFLVGPVKLFFRMR